MITKVRKYLITTSLACVTLGTALCLTMGSSYYAPSSESVSTQKMLSKYEQSVVEEYEEALKNFDLKNFVKDYNEKFNVSWKATKIEYSSPIYIKQEDKYGIYLDFDGDNGFLVAIADTKTPKYHYNAFTIKRHGDLGYLRDGRELYFSYSNGIGYIDKNGEYVYCQNENGRDLFEQELE